MPFEKALGFKTPKCNIHIYCEDCLTKKNRNKSFEDSDCLLYFRSIGCAIEAKSCNLC